MNRKVLGQKLKHILSVFSFTVGLIVLSILLKSETSLESNNAETPIVNEYNVYDQEITLVKGQGKLKRDFNQMHIKCAKQTGVCSIQDSAQLFQNIADNNLIRVIADKGYLLGDMTHSYPYLTKSSVLTLRKIGASFYAASGDGSAFTVSSIARTEDTQKSLRKRNSNASKRESSHTFGVSFDISYIRYNGCREWNYEYTKALEGILAELQKSGEIYVLKERNQSCFHITVRT
jgi:hypothetical protein